MMDSATSKLNSQAFDLLRFPLCVLVVCEHLFGALSNHGIIYNADDYFTVYIFELTKMTFFSDANVPLFFLISGFLFFYNVDLNAEVYKRKIKSRVKTLLIPYIIWNTFELLRISTKHFLLLVPGISSFSSETYKLNFSLTNILSCYWNNYPGIQSTTLARSVAPIDNPLWYIRDLMIAVLLAPVAYFLIKKFKYSIVFLFGVAWFVFFSITSDYDAFLYRRITRLCTAFFFFYWGAYMSIYKVNIVEKFGRLLKPSIVAYISTCTLYILSTFYFPDYSRLIHSFTIVSFVVAAYNVAVWLLKHNICKVSKFLAGASFIVYVAHMILLPHVEKIFLTILQPINNFTLFAVYILTLAATVLSLLGVYYLLKRFAPPVLKVLTGRC